LLPQEIAVGNKRGQKKTKGGNAAFQALYEEAFRNRPASTCPDVAGSVQRFAWDRGDPWGNVDVDGAARRLADELDRLSGEARQDAIQQLRAAGTRDYGDEHASLNAKLLIGETLKLLR